MKTAAPYTPTPYTPTQVLNNLRNFVHELRHHTDNLPVGPGFVRHQCESILARGIADTLPTTPGSLLDTLANVTAALENCLLHHGQLMPAADLYQRQMLVAATKHTLQQHGLTV
jgi:hypothetical protein